MKKLKSFTGSLLTTLLALSFCAVAYAADQPDWQRLEEEAERCFLSGEKVKSERLFQEALALTRVASKQAENAQSSQPGEQLAEAEILNQMTHLFLSEKRYSEAREALNKAIKIRREKLGEQSEKVAESLGNLALIEHRDGNDALAEKYYKEAIAIKTAAGSSSLAVTLTNFANFYSDKKRFAEAKPLYEQALALDKKEFGENHIEVARDLFNLGGMYYHHNYFKEALTYFELALSAYKKLDNVGGQAKCHHYIGLCLFADNQHEKAGQSYAEALGLQETLKGKNHPDTFVHKLNMAKSFDFAGKSDRAEEIYRQSLQSAGDVQKEAKLKFVECSIEYAHFLRRHNRNNEAEKILEAALTSYETLNSEDRRKLYELPRVYSDLLRELKKDEAAHEMAHRHLHVYGQSHKKPASTSKEKTQAKEPARNGSSSASKQERKAP